jgi:hypothetical protein
MRFQSIALAAAMVLLSIPAFGQPGADRRIIPTDDGFMEIDLQSGAVTQCQRAPDGYRCAPAKSDPNALQAELERLRKENAELRDQLAQRGPGLGPNQRTKPPQPTDQEIDRALDVMERFLRRFIGIMRDEKADRT